MTIRYVVTDNRAYPPGALLDPDGGVRVTIYQPDGTVALGPAAMTKVTNDPQFPKGLYEYLYQTTGASPTGAWMVEADVTHLGYVSLSLKDPAFILEA